MACSNHRHKQNEYPLSFVNQTFPKNCYGTNKTKVCMTLDPSNMQFWYFLKAMAPQHSEEVAHQRILKDFSWQRFLNIRMRYPENGWYEENDYIATASASFREKNVQKSFRELPRPAPRELFKVLCPFSAYHLDRGFLTLLRWNFMDELYGVSLFSIRNTGTSK